jgi:hypothetical protein
VAQPAEWDELDRLEKAMDEAKDVTEYIALEDEWAKIPVEIRRAWIKARWQELEKVRTEK